MNETITAARLAYDHIGSRVSWAVPDPVALFDQDTPVGTLDWISHTEGAVVVGVTFIEPAEFGTPEHRTVFLDGQRVVVTSDDYWLDPRTQVTIHSDEPRDRLDTSLRTSRGNSRPALPGADAGDIHSR